MKFKLLAHTADVFSVHYLKNVTICFPSLAFKALLPCRMVCQDDDENELSKWTGGVSITLSLTTHLKHMA